jgi:hypothetical protein
MLSYRGNIGYCDTHKCWSHVDPDTATFNCGEEAIWDGPKGRYISIQQLDREARVLA